MYIVNQLAKASFKVKQGPNKVEFCGSAGTEPRKKWVALVQVDYVVETHMVFKTK